MHALSAIDAAQVCGSGCCQADFRSSWLLNLWTVLARAAVRRYINMRRSILRWRGHRRRCEIN
jgi:hypothetical protein